MTTTAQLLEQQGHVALVRNLEQERYRNELKTLADDLEQFVCSCSACLCDRIYYGNVAYTMRAMALSVRMANPQSIQWAKQHIEQAKATHDDHTKHNDTGHAFFAVKVA